MAAVIIPANVYSYSEIQLVFPFPVGILPDHNIHYDPLAEIVHREPCENLLPAASETAADEDKEAMMLLGTIFRSVRNIGAMLAGMDGRLFDMGRRLESIEAKLEA